ncbi:MAG TPA: hypothetical protein DCP20_06515 [Coriobacteriia bacterium]|nr:hypothetical protein [Coriobacteriia bacterium]
MRVRHIKGETSVDTDIGGRISEARERLGMSQAELAERSGVGVRQTITEIEAGRRQVRASELVSLASALRTDFAWLLGSKEPRTPCVLWRERADSAAETEATFLNLYQRFHQVLTCCDQRPSDILPQFKEDPSSFTYEDATRLADTMSRTLSLGSRPASSLASVLESVYDVMIWYMPLGHDGSAASLRDSDGCAILINSNEAPWRRNFDLAHELFHLVTWNSFIATIQDDPEFAKIAETLANVFASSLLLPADELRLVLESRIANNSMEHADVVDVAREFGVSSSALLWRMRVLGYLSTTSVRQLLGDTEFKRVDRASISSQWQEPSPYPERYVRLAFNAFSRGRLSRSMLAQYLGTRMPGLDAVLADYGVTESSSGPITLDSNPFNLNDLSDDDAPALRTS